MTGMNRAISLLGLGLMAIWFSVPAGAEDFDFQRWGDGYYAGMRLDDAEFDEHESRILRNLTSAQQGKLSNIWSFYALRDWPTERYERHKEALWRSATQDPSWCLVAQEYLEPESDDRQRERSSSSIASNERYEDLKRGVAECVAGLGDPGG